MTNCVFSINTDIDSLIRESEALGEEADRIKAVITSILNKHPQGIARDDLLREVPDTENQKNVHTLLALMITERSILFISADKHQ